jgi:nuclear transport factor 2 (NTF2) superfamily protein
MFALSPNGRKRSLLTKASPLRSANIFAFKFQNTMSALNETLLKKAYDAFNARNINAVLLLMHTDVHWPNGWEGGYVDGHEQVREYWARQWKEIDPHVEPLAFKEREDGRIEVEVHQVVKDLRGKLLSDGIVKHVYTIEDNLIKNMEIEKA